MTELINDNGVCRAALGIAWVCYKGELLSKSQLINTIYLSAAAFQIFLRKMAQSMFWLKFYHAPLPFLTCV